MVHRGMMMKGGRTEGAFLLRRVTVNGLLKLRISVLIGKIQFIHDRLSPFEHGGKLFFLKDVTGENS